MTGSRNLRRLLVLLSKGSDLEAAALGSGYDGAGDAGAALEALAADLDDGMPEGREAGPEREEEDHISAQCAGSLVVYTDGAARGNPGPAAAAAVIYDAGGREVYRKGLKLGKATNNEAEYRGLILGLELAHRLGGREVTVRMDSELVVRQMKGDYRIKKEHLQGLARIAAEKAGVFDRVTYVHVPRTENAEADRLAGALLDKTEEQALE